MLRTSRCASTQLSADTNWYASTPMFRKRPSTSSTLLAWTVVNTRWPVSAELIAICAVSVSRISPTMILSGSWRRIDRSPRANVSPFFSLIGICVMPLQLVLDRVLDRDDLVLDRLDLRQRRIERRRLAAAGRPGDEHHAVRLGDVLPEALQLGLREAEDVEPQLGELLADRLLVEDADDRVLAVDARHDRDAEVDRLARHAQLEAAVLRHALLGDVELRHDLDARDDRAVELLGDRPHRRLQHAVDAVLHVDRVVLRLDVDVARAPLDRGVDRRVDQPDDRADVARQPLDGEAVVAVLLFLQQLQLEALGRLLEHALRALALLQDRLDGRARPDRRP